LFIEGTLGLVKSELESETLSTSSGQREETEGKGDAPPVPASLEPTIRSLRSLITNERKKKDERTNEKKKRKNERTKERKNERKKERKERKDS